jgi:hypothetical protein
MSPESLNRKARSAASLLEELNRVERPSRALVDRYASEAAEWTLLYLESQGVRISSGARRRYHDSVRESWRQGYGFGTIAWRQQVRRGRDARHALDQCIAASAQSVIFHQNPSRVAKTRTRAREQRRRSRARARSPGGEDPPDEPSDHLAPRPKVSSEAYWRLWALTRDPRALLRWSRSLDESTKAPA